MGKGEKKRNKKIKKGKLYITGKIGSALVFAAIEKKIISRIIKPTLAGMKKIGSPFFRNFICRTYDK